MKKIFTYASLLLIILALSSCEGNTSRTRLIKNNTSASISVVAEGINVTDYDKTIAKGETETLYIGEQLGGSGTVELPSTGINSLTITNAAGDTCTKDFSIQANWEIVVDERKKVPSDWRHEYTFSVSDNDF